MKTESAWQRDYRARSCLNALTMQLNDNSKSRRNRSVVPIKSGIPGHICYCDLICICRGTVLLFYCYSEMLCHSKWLRFLCRINSQAKGTNK